MSYELIGEDDSVFKIKHPDGSEFHIAKKSVDSSVHSKIRNLKPVNMADGGVAEPQFEQTTVDPVNTTETLPEGIERVPAAEASKLGLQPDNVPVDPIANASVQQPPISQQSILAPQSSNPTPDAFNMEAQNKSLEEEKKINENLAKQQATNYGALAENAKNIGTEVQKINAHFDPIETKLRQTNDTLFTEVQNAKVNPNRYFSEMSTGNKILAAISVGLAGLGQGLQGPGAKNMAMEVINKAIDRDVEAQRLELGKKQTLFSENLRQLGDIHAAKAATTAQLLTIAQSKAQMISAQSGSAETQARMQLANKEIDLRKAQLNQQATLRSMGTKGGNFDPSLLVPAIVPAEHQKSVFGEIERAQDTRRMGGSIMKAFDQAEKENTFFKTGAGLARTPPGVYALHQAMQPTFKDLEGTVRQAAMDNTFQNITPRPGDMPSTIKTKRTALEDYLKSKASAPTAKGFGIDLDKFQSTNTQQSQVPIKTVNGIRYMRGPNGEAIQVQ